jgi:hypothetical protein
VWLGLGLGIRGSSVRVWFKIRCYDFVAVPICYHSVELCPELD